MLDVEGQRCGTRLRIVFHHGLLILFHGLLILFRGLPILFRLCLGATHMDTLL